MSIQLSWQKVFITLGVVLCCIVLGLIITFISIFTSLQSEKGSIEKGALQTAKAESPITKADQTYIYNGDNSYVVITGQTNDGEEIHVFVPQDQSIEIEWTNASEGLTQDEMTQKWSGTCGQCDLKDMNLGIMNNRYIWEIIYEKNNRLYFQTYRYINGELYDSISFLKNK